MPRVVKSREEFEGEIFESLVLVEGADLPLPAAGTEFTEIAKSRRRVDGVQRVTGHARYTQDVYLPGMLHVRVLRSPYPRARVRRIDTKKAEKLPGVRDVLHRFNAPKAAFRGEETIFREEVRFVGDEVAAVAADDEQTAVEALRLIEVDYELLPHVVDLEEAIGDMAPRLSAATRSGRSRRPISSSTRRTGPRRSCTTRSRRMERSRRGTASSSPCTSQRSTSSVYGRDSAPR